MALGNHNWSVACWDNERSIISETWQFTVVPFVNDAPILDPIGNKEINEGQLLTIDVNAFDEEGNTLTYYTSANFGTFNQNTGVFEWRPSYEDAGIYSIKFNVSDNYLWDSETINITVNNVSLLISDETEDAASCSGNCHSSYYRGYDEDWGSVAADNGNCSQSAKDKPTCILNGLGTSIVEEYNWNSNWLNGNVILETKYWIKNNNIGKFNVSCYNNTGWQNIYDDYGVKYPYIITQNVTVPQSCIIPNQPLKIKHKIIGGPLMAPTFYYESRIWYYST